jgi:hypothetical protein
MEDPFLFFSAVTLLRCASALNALHATAPKRQCQARCVVELGGLLTAWGQDQQHSY